MGGGRHSFTTMTELTGRIARIGKDVPEARLIGGQKGIDHHG